MAVSFKGTPAKILLDLERNRPRGFMRLKRHPHECAGDCSDWRACSVLGAVEVGRAQWARAIGAGTMVKSRSARKTPGKRTDSVWKEFLLLSMFVVLLGAALTATWANGPMPQMKGAWVTQAMR
jgi:hypothetical protein